MNISTKIILLIITIGLVASLNIKADHFETGSDIPTEELLTRLDDVYSSKIKDKQVLSIQVEGHADSRGNAEYNLNLSQKRAESAARYLQQLGTKSEISPIGFGETQLVSLGTSLEEHAKNRRVVVIVKTPEGESKTVISEADKHKCQVIVKTRTIKVVERKLNRITLLATQKRTGLRTANSASQVEVTSKTEVVPALLYQRSFGNFSGSIGVDAQGLGSVGVGYDF